MSAAFLVLAEEATAVGSVNFYSLTREELVETVVKNFDETKFRAEQLFEWVYRHEVEDFNLMTNLSKSFREKAARYFSFPHYAYDNRQISTDGTRKYLFRVEKNSQVESVMIKQPTRMTLCVSSQVGCAMGCTFCKTGTMGLMRNLGVQEIVGQLLGVRRDAKQFEDMFSNIVFMGMGEPLHNLKNVVNACKIILDPKGWGMTPRKITISTSGLVPAIKKLGESKIDVNLAISLNATTDEVRDVIMPVNKKYPLEVLLQTLKEYPLKPRKLITMEYVMLDGVNDSDDDLKRLPKLLSGVRCKLNLIPYNFNSDLGFKSSSTNRVRKWQDFLLNRGIETTIRWSKGQDISAACGQLVSESKRG